MNAKCSHCGWIGQAPEFDRPAPGARSADDTYPVPYCLACQSTDVSPVVLCTECGEREAIEGADQCEPCLQVLENVEARQERELADYKRRNAA
jgi:hypothetical protein